MLAGPEPFMLNFHQNLPSFDVGVEDAGCAGHRLLGPEYKLKQNIRIAMLYLEDDDAVNAEAYIKKASSLIASSKVQPQRSLHPISPRTTSCPKP